MMLSSSPTNLNDLRILPFLITILNDAVYSKQKVTNQADRSDVNVLIATSHQIPLALDT